MPAYKRNLSVGLTVLIAAGIFGWMLLRFGSKTATLFAKPQHPIEIDAPRVDGLSEGSPLTYQGVNVGRITQLARRSDGNGVVIRAVLDTQPPVPVNVDALIRTTNLIGGGAAIALELKSDPTSGVEQTPQFVDVANYPTLHAVYVGLSLNIIPREYGNTAAQISRAAAAIAQTSDDLRATGFVKHLDAAVQNINVQVDHAGRVIDALDEAMGTDASKQDLRQTLADAHRATANIAAFSDNLAKFSDQFTATINDTHGTILSTQGHIDDVSKQLATTLSQTSALLDSLHRVADKIDSGKGTAGMLINDQRLYQSLVDAGKTLDQTLRDVQRLVQQWEQEGLGLKLK